MADNQVLAEVSGLQVSNNTFSATPPGSLAIAENVMVVQKGVAQPRNGQARAYTMSAANKVPFALAEFLGSIIASAAIDKFDDEHRLGIAANPLVPFTSFGSVFNPVDFDGVSSAYGRMKFAQADRFLYFCTTTGPKALETLASQPRAAGLRRMPDLLPLMLSKSQPGPWMPYNRAVAYRSVLRLPTSSGASLLSPPSGRAVLSSRLLAPGRSVTPPITGAMVRSGGATVTVTFPINPTNSSIGLSVGDTFTLSPGEADFPAGTYTVATKPAANVITYASAGANVDNAVAQDFDTGPRATNITVYLSADATINTPVRLYRSLATSSSTVEPSDEMFLVAEVFPVALDITNGFVVIDDTMPESQLSDPLYTNPQTGEGASQANFAPPLYRDLAYWGSRMWYLNTTGRQQFNLQLLGVGTPDGAQNNDTLRLDIPSSSTSYTFTFKTTPAASGDVQLVSTGTPSFNAQQTALNLVLQINTVLKAANEPLRAYYASEQDGSFGKVLLERTDYAVSAGNQEFGVRASRPESWMPALKTASDVMSTAERRPSGLDYSKLGQAEAVPPTNRTAVGSSNWNGARILALQNALLVFKQGDGIWAVTGSAPFQVQQISTANLLAIDAAAVFADAAWAYTDHGILRVSDAGGAVVVSRPIETELAYYRDRFPDETADWSFAVPYETERRIMFFVPVATFSAGSPPTTLPRMQAYCYNNATDTWTKYTYEAFSGVVSTTEQKLYLGTYDEPWATSRITSERKGRGHLDTADEDFAGTIDLVAYDPQGKPCVQLASLTDVEAGDGIVQGVWRTKIKQLRPDLGPLWVETYENLTTVLAIASPCDLFKHFVVKPLFQPTGSPTSRKSLTRLSFIFQPDGYAALGGKALVMTDQAQAELEVSAPLKGFGLNPFGQGPFGDPSPMVLDVNPIDAKWTNAAQFFVGLKLSEVWVKMRLQGFSATLATQDAPAGRGK